MHESEYFIASKLHRFCYVFVNKKLNIEQQQNVDALRGNCFS